MKLRRTRMWRATLPRAAGAMLLGGVGFVAAPASQPGAVPALCLVSRPITTTSLTASYSECNGTVALHVSGGSEDATTELAAMAHGGAVLEWAGGDPELAMFHGAQATDAGVALVFDTGGVIVALVLDPQQGSSARLVGGLPGVPEIFAATSDGTPWLPDLAAPCALVARSGGAGAVGFEVGCPRLWPLTKSPSRQPGAELHGVFVAWSQQAGVG